MRTLQAKSEELYALCPETVAADAQARFMRESAGLHSRGLKKMIEGLEDYCNAHRKDWGEIGDDSYCGPYVESIARSLIGLLSGPGTFDGGTLWKAIAEIAEGNGISIE